jgi:hypothetical protein
VARLITWNTRLRGNEGFFLLEHALIDIGVGMRWLKEDAKVDRVSSSATLVAAH